MRRQLNGYVVADDDAFFYHYFGISVCCPGDVAAAVKDFAENPDDEGLIFEVNSPGGSLFVGLQMWTALADAKRIYNVKCTAEVQSIAASSASVFIAGCDTVLVSPVAQIMMHLPSTYTEGNENDHMESVGMLQAGLNSILAAYEAKCKPKSARGDLEALTRATSFLTAQQAVDIGLADGIIDYSDKAEGDPMSLVACAAAGIRTISAACGLPDIKDLRAKYDAEKHGENPKDGDGAEGGPGDEPAQVPGDGASDTTPTAGEPTMHDDWRIGAKLELEKIRF